MHIKASILALSLIIIIQGASFAAISSSVVQENNVSNGAELQNNTQIAVVQEVMRDMLKSTLYNVGSQVLNKYIGPTNGIIPVYTQTTPTYTYTAPVTTTTSQPTTTTTTTTNTTTQQTTQPASNGTNSDQPTEQMIPVS